MQDTIYLKMSATLYLIPVTLGDTPVSRVLPAYPLEILQGLEHFVVEDLRSARRFLRKAGIEKDFENLRFHLLNEHSRDRELDEMLGVLLEGKSMGVLSEAGAPAIADPGASLVAKAHRNGIRVIPLAGPSSILLALMASGLNGQAFRFHGYLPVKSPARIDRIRQMEKYAYAGGETQIFMETPYRNMSLLKDLLAHCREGTMLCIAADISLETEFIKTRSIREWRKQVPQLHKRPAVFLLNGGPGQLITP